MIELKELKTLDENTRVWYGKVRFSWWRLKLSGIAIKEVKIIPRRWWCGVIKLLSPDGKQLSYNGHPEDLYRTVEDAISGVNNDLCEIQDQLQKYVDLIPGIEEMKIK